MSPKFKLTEEQELEVVRRYESGDSIRKITEDFPVGRTSIGYVLSRYNVETRGVGNSYGLRKFSVDHSYFKNINTEEKAYWLGFISADGHVADDGIIIALNQQDMKHLESFADAVSSNSEIKHIINTNAVRLSVYSKQMVENLRNLGFYKNKSETQTFPEINNELRKHFIRGLFDGDGCLSIRKRNNPRYKGEIDFHVSLSGTLDTIKIVQEIIDQECSVGINKIIKSGNILKSIQWGGKRKVLKILDWLYSDSSVSLKRKYDKYIMIKEGVFSNDA